MNALPGVANTFGATMVKTDGSAITAGTVNFYLVALSGANAGKWFRGSDQTWQVAEAIAAAGTHEGKGHWAGSIVAAAWTDGVNYRLYAAESGNLSIPYGYDVACVPTPPTAAQVEAAVVADAAFKRLLAFAGEYRRVTSIVYDGAEVESATIKLYESQAKFDADEPSATVEYLATIVAGQVTAHSSERQT